MSRIEKDYLGEIELPDDAYYGVQTARALKNFPVSGITERPEFIKAYVLVKKSAALVNMELGELDEEKGNAIVKAADDVLSEGYENQFPVDVFQAGAGTSFNMNINEVLANRALEILGREKGEYDFLSPNDHVNMAQSTNDTFPTASHIAVIISADNLMKALSDLSGAFALKGKDFAHISKSGRTHLMDATPLTLGHEFSAYASAIQRAKDRIALTRDGLLELAIGGTAVGTGANAHTQYRKVMIRTLSVLCDMEFIPAKDSFEALQSRSQMAAFSGALRELAFELIRIANDLRLLASGPTAGLAEIRLPAVQPGSSIMPGKINPVMAECLNMVAFQVIGNDAAVAMAAQAGQLDLNVMTPVMTYNILFSLEILNNYLPVFRQRCIEGIVANEVKSQAYLELNPSLATLLAPKIGFMEAAQLAKEAYEKGVSVPKLAVEKGLITREEADEIFDVEKIAKGKYEKK